MDDEDINDIVLYHGSLAELNSRYHRQEQYELGREVYYISSDFDEENFERKAKTEIKNLGYLGIVNCRTLFCGSRDFSDFYRVEGTPIVKRVL